MSYEQLVLFFKQPSHLLADALYTHFTLRRRHELHDDFLELVPAEARTPAPPATESAKVAATGEADSAMRGLVTLDTRVRRLRGVADSDFLELRIMSSLVKPLENEQGRPLELHDLHGMNLMTFSLATMMNDSSANLMGVLLLKRLLIWVDDTFM